MGRTAHCGRPGVRAAFGARVRGRSAAFAFSTPTRGVQLNAPTAYEQLCLLHPAENGEGLTKLGIPGFAGFFLSLLEVDGWAVSATPAFASPDGEILIVAAHGDRHVQAAGDPATAAVDVYRQARELEHDARKEHRA